MRINARRRHLDRSHKIDGKHMADLDAGSAVPGIATFDDLVATLALPGRQLIFCDETSLQGQVAKGMEPDIEVMCAICLPSDGYPTVAKVIAQRLTHLGVSEFHAKEVVNPNKTSAWFEVSFEDRVETFRLMSHLLRDDVEKAGYLFVTRSDFEQMKVVAGGPMSLGVGQKSGLRKVTLKCATEQFATGAVPTVLVVDQAKASSKPQLTLPHGSLVGGGVIVADSAKIIGLQLADMAAYCLGRYLRKREVLQAGEGGPFDQIALETIADFHGRLRFLLSSEASSPPA